MSGLMTIGKLAAAAQVRAGTVRYYESIGLLPQPARSCAGYRLYAPEIVRRLTVVRSAQRFGFSLREIAAFLRVREAGGRPCQTVRDAAGQLLGELDAEIAALKARRRRMAGTLRAWDRILARTPHERRAHLLERL